MYAILQGETNATDDFLWNAHYMQSGMSFISVRFLFWVFVYLFVWWWCVCERECMCVFLFVCLNFQLLISDELQSDSVD